MKPSVPQIRIHRILGTAAVIHSLVVLVLFIALVGSSWSSWPALVWIGFAALWLVWPIILLVHRGRSFWRVTTPLLAGYIFYFFWSTPYSQAIEGVIGSPQKYDLPFGVELTPHSVLEYFVWYAAGWMRGKIDASKGQLVLEGYGFGFEAPRAPHFSNEVAKRYGIQFLPVSGCLINERLVGHAYGRNDVTISEIKKRFGAKVVTDAEEADRRWQEAQATAAEMGRADAKKDLSEGRLIVEVYEASDVTDYAKLLQQKYGIELKEGRLERRSKCR